MSAITAFIKRVVRLCFGVPFALLLAALTLFVTAAVIVLGAAVVATIGIACAVLLAVLPWLTFFGLNNQSEKIKAKLNDNVFQFKSK